MLAPRRTIFPTWDLPEAAGRAGGSVPVGLVGGRNEHACASSADGTLILSDRFPHPAPSQQGWNGEATTSGPEIETPHKKRKKKGVGEKTPHSDTFALFFDCLLKAGSAGMWENPTRLLHAPHAVSLTLFLHETHLQPCHVPAEVCLLQATIHIEQGCSSTACWQLTLVHGDAAVMRH